MFTGIVKEVAEVTAVYPKKGGKIIKIKTKKLNLEIGDSVAINGVCLTITNFKHEEIETFIGERSLKVTNLKKLTPGTKVNVEPALRLVDRIGGHLVQGHIDIVGKVIKKLSLQNGVIVEISFPSHYFKYVVENGSIAVEGVSLTIAKVKNSSIEVFLVPHTLENTTLGRVKIGEELNLEFDILAKYLR
jgi:riboflavin synthase